MYDAKRSEETKDRKRLKGKEYSKNRYLDPNYCADRQEQRQIKWEKSIVSNSRSTDREAGRTYNETDYITVDFLRDLLKQQNGLCAYCKDEMKYGKGINRNTNPSGLSIQRIVTTIAHIQTNCVFTCMLCNTMEVSIPHEVMLQHGKELRLGTLLYCSSRFHIGDKVVSYKNWDMYFPYCRSCRREEQDLRNANKRQKRLEKKIIKSI
jgi:hypothetical protein